MTDSTITCDQCGTEFERDVEAEVELCFDCAVRKIRKERQAATKEDIAIPDPGREGEKLSQGPLFEVDDGE